MRGSHLEDLENQGSIRPEWSLPAIALTGLLLGYLALRWLIAQLHPTRVRRIELDARADVAALRRRIEVDAVTHSRHALDQPQLPVRFPPGRLTAGGRATTRNRVASEQLLWTSGRAHTR